MTLYADSADYDDFGFGCADALVSDGNEASSDSRLFAKRGAALTENLNANEPNQQIDRSINHYSARALGLKTRRLLLRSPGQHHV